MSRALTWSRNLFLSSKTLTQHKHGSWFLATLWFLFDRSAGRTAAGLSGPSGRRCPSRRTRARRCPSSSTLGRQVTTSKRENRSFVVCEENDTREHHLIRCQMTKAPRWIKTSSTLFCSTRRASDTATRWRTIRWPERCRRKERWPWSCAPSPTRSVQIHRSTEKRRGKVTFATSEQLIGICNVAARGRHRSQILGGRRHVLVCFSVDD